MAMIGANLPDFLIIGAQKSGTTSLYGLLCQHPCVKRARRKEVHFFDTHYERGIEWYREHFPKTAPGKLTGEASPSYISIPSTAGRVWEAVPGVRLIVLLRDPVERAFSNYHHEVRAGRESIPFEQTEEVSVALETGDTDAVKKVLSDADVMTRRYRSYITRGFYAEQLEEWLSYFPREQMLVLKSEEFFERTLEETRRAYAFLGLEDFTPKVPKWLNRGEYGAEMNPATREKLEAFYEPHNQRLSELIDV